MKIVIIHGFRLTLITQTGYAKVVVHQYVLNPLVHFHQLTHTVTHTVKFSPCIKYLG